MPKQTPEQIRDWVLANVPPGAIVHVKGTAKKPAYRLVERIAVDAFGDAVLVGTHLAYDYDRLPGDAVLEFLERKPEEEALQTEHALHNVSHIIVALTPHQTERRDTPRTVSRYEAVTIGRAMRDGVAVPALAGVLAGWRPVPAADAAAEPPPDVLTALGTLTALAARLTGQEAAAVRLAAGALQRENGL